MRAKVAIHGEIEQGLLHDFLQHVRDFESEHTEEMHFDIRIEAPTASVEEMEQAVDIYPPLPHKVVIRKDN